MNDPSGTLVVERIRCHNATRSGIIVRQFVEGQALHAVIRDNVISNVNTTTAVSTPSIAIAHNTTGELQVVVTGNQILNNRTTGLSVRGDDAAASGQVTGNLASGNGATGIFVLPDLVVAKNIAASNGTNYLVSSQQAAPITALDQNPGP